MESVLIRGGGEGTKTKYPEVSFEKLAPMCTNNVARYLSPFLVREEVVV